MKMAKNLVLLGMMGVVTVCLPSIAMGQNAAGDAPAPPPPQLTVVPMPVQPYTAPVDEYGPMGGFTLAPRIGYAYLGGQASEFISGDQNASGSVFEKNINAMKIDLDLKFGGKGGSFELAPFYMLMAWDLPGNVEKMHVFGLDLGFLYSWYIPAGGSAFYPGVGFGIGFGPIFNDPFESTFAMLIFEKLNVSCTFYPSRNAPIGIVFEWGIGMHTDFYVNKANDKSEALMVYGLYTDLTLGVRFF